MKLFLVGLLMSVAAWCGPFAGRWDIAMTAPDSSYPQWMELVEKDGQLQIRIQPRGGAVRPAVSAKADGNKLSIVVSEKPAINWELTADGDKFTGVQKTADKETAKIAGVRAPALDRKMPKKWTKPASLINGKDLTGWEVIAGRRESKWVAKDGELINEDSGANIKTTRKFDDFKLHIEYNVPDHGNSGLYLRGRYEIQIGTEGGKRPLTEMGAIYGYYPQGKDLPLRLGEWQSYDVTLVGRRVTVVRNGVTIHDNVEIPGITGGALDSNEGEPGPFFLQGDHQGRLRFRNMTVSVPEPEGLAGMWYYKNASVQFSEGGRVSGMAGCNRMNGSYMSKGKDLKFGAVMTTKMACMGPGAETEKEVLNALEATTKFRMKGASLWLLNASGKELVQLERNP